MLTGYIQPVSKLAGVVNRTPGTVAVYAVTSFFNVLTAADETEELSRVSAPEVVSGVEEYVLPLVNSSTISAESITLGDSVTLTGAASGGTSPYYYAFYYKRVSQTSWATAQDYSTTESVAIKPNAATTYDVCVKVMDSDGTIAKLYFTLTVSEEE